MSRRKEPAIPNELLDQLLAGGAASAAFEQGGLLDSLKKALTERALNAEMDHHLAGEDGAGNMRNGYGRKTVMTDIGKLAINVPRDRQSSFDPQLIAKYQRRFPGFDDKIVSMYARGMSTREITRYSRRMHIQASMRERQVDWFEGMEAAFLRFGGVPVEVLVDNAKALVEHHDAATLEVRFNAHRITLEGDSMRKTRPAPLLTDIEKAEIITV